MASCSTLGTTGIAIVDQYTIGIAWYDRDEYQRIRLAVADPHNFHPDYDAWLKLAEKIEQTHQRNGAITIRVNLNLDSLRIWCEQQWPPNLDATACAYYAQEIASRWGRED